MRRWKKPFIEGLSSSRTRDGYLETGKGYKPTCEQCFLLLVEYASMILSTSFLFFPKFLHWKDDKFIIWKKKSYFEKYLKKTIWSCPIRVDKVKFRKEEIKVQKSYCLITGWQKLFCGKSKAGRNIQWPLTLTPTNLAHTPHSHTHIHTHFQALLIFFGIFNQGLYITTTSALLIFTAKWSVKQMVEKVKTYSYLDFIINKEKGLLVPTV